MTCVDAQNSRNNLDLLLVFVVALLLGLLSQRAVVGPVEGTVHADPKGHGVARGGKGWRADGPAELLKEGHGRGFGASLCSGGGDAHRAGKAYRHAA